MSIFSFLDSRKRGRSRRRRKLSATLTPASESLESRLLLSAASSDLVYRPALYPTYEPAPGSNMGGSSNDPVFEFGSDVVISWSPASSSMDFDIRIYHVDTGQEVVNENNLASPRFTPASLTEAGRYQVFVRQTDVNDQTGNWNLSSHFTLTAGENEHPLGTAQFIELTDDPTPALTWTAARQETHLVTIEYEVVIYNVAAGREVFRQSNIQDTRIELGKLLDSGDEFQAFVRTHRTTSGLALTSIGSSTLPLFIPPPSSVEISDWSAPFHFTGTGDSSLIPPAAVYNLAEETIEWQPIDNATSYDVVVYDRNTGQEFSSVTGSTDPSYALMDLNESFYELQAFYRVRHDDGSTGFWSDALEIQVLINPGPIVWSVD